MKNNLLRILQLSLALLGPVLLQSCFESHEPYYGSYGSPYAYEAAPLYEVPRYYYGPNHEEHEEERERYNAQQAFQRHRTDDRAAYGRHRAEAREAYEEHHER